VDDKTAPRSEGGTTELLESEHERTADALRASEERLLLAQTAGGVGVWDWETATGRTYWSDQMWTIYGLEPGPEPPSDELWQSRLHPEDYERMTSAMERFLASEETEYHYEFRIVRPDGEVRWVESVARLKRSDTGTAVRLSGVNFDITARKQTEEALRRSEEELRRAAAELSEADRRKDEFLATLAHELRNPLSPIRNALQILRITGTPDPRTQWGWDVIDRQVDHLTRLIDDLLDVSRITRNKLELRKQRVQLADVVHAAVENCRPLIDQSRHQVTVTLPPEPIILEADQVRLVQVLMNLLNNAIKYTPAGGRIRLTAERHGAEVRVSVEDTGIGIPPDELARLFDMFYQVDRTLERSYGGLGIGLTLVRRLVEMHGGSIDARSAGPDQGSQLVVRLPVLTEPAAPQPEPGGRGPGKSSTHRILVVDDNVDSADSLALMLELGGHEVRVANDGLEALETARDFLPGVVLLDLGMPKLSGYEVARLIRQEPWGQDLVLIAQTGWGQEEDRRRTHEAGFDAHLTKPLDHALLKELLGDLSTHR